MNSPDHATGTGFCGPHVRIPDASSNSAATVVYPADVDEFVAWFESQDRAPDLVGVASWWRARIAGHHDRAGTRT